MHGWMLLIRMEKELDGERKVKVQLMQDVKGLEMKLEKK